MNKDNYINNYQNNFNFYKTSTNFNNRNKFNDKNKYTYSPNYIDDEYINNFNKYHKKKSSKNINATYQYIGKAS